MRIYLLFVVSAAFPVFALILFSYGFLTQQYDLELKQQLRRDAKSYGYQLFERLDLAEANLGTLHGSMLESGAIEQLFSDLLQQRFRGIALLDADWSVIRRLGERFPLPGRLVTLAGLTRANPAMLLPLALDDGSTGVLMARPLQTGEGRIRWVAALLDPGFLWGRASELDPNIMLCVLGAEGHPLFCPDTRLRRLAKDSMQHAHPAPAAGPLSHQSWSLFIGSRFQEGYWRVFAATSGSNALDTFAGFRHILPRVTVLTLLVVALLSVYLIRKSFVPFEALMAGIRRISENDFSIPVRISGGDELGTIADAFNRMTRRIQKDLRRLTALASIDKAILARPTQPEIIDTILQRAEESMETEMVAIAVRNRRSDAFTVFQHHTIEGRGPETREFRLDRKDLDRLRRLGPHQLSDASDECPTLLEPIKKAGARRILLLPVSGQQERELAGLFVLGYALPRKLNRGQIDQAREFAHRVAVALADAAREERLQYLAYHDPLTNLPNRLLLRDRIDLSLAQGRRDHTSVAVMFIDLDRFKSVNDSLGHKAGDLLLEEMASRLMHSVRNGDTVARLSGDEFVVAAANLHGNGDAGISAVTIADKILASAAAPFHFHGHEIRLTASIGIAVFPGDGTETDILLKNADAAMYHAKQLGRNSYQFYSEDLNSKALSRLDLAAAMHRALDAGEFRVFFQPKLDLKRRRVTGVEALLRWDHPERGLLYPDEFIGLAEETGLIIDLGRWVLQRACQETRSWQRSGTGKELSVSVNISPRQFGQSHVVEMVREALAASGLSPSTLELEITEGTAMQNPHHSIETMRALRNMGVKVSIDDFGMGYSSLSYIKHFPLDVLKIDKSFVLHMESEPTDYAIVKSIIVLAHSLNLKVVAEGVETRRQLGILSELECDLAQGYLCSPPVGKERFTDLLEQGICSGPLEAA